MTVLFLPIALAFLVGMVRSLDFPIYEILLMLLFFALAIVPAYTTFSSRRKFTDYIRYAASSGELQVLLNDFTYGQSLADDNIRLGEKYIFCRKKGRPLGYNEITKVYQAIQKTNSAENRRTLEAVLTNGKTYVLCELKKHGGSDRDVSKILGYIQQKNPNVHLGYK